MRLVLVRHGQTTSNVGRHLDTAEPGADLTPLGRAQALALVDALRGEAVEAVYASTLVRTQQTAAPLAAALGVDVVVRDGLREISAGALEMANDDASVDTYLSVALGWADGALDARMPGTDDDGRAVLTRFDAVVDEVAAAGVGTAVLVSHGAMIRVWAGARCGNVDAGFAARHAISNTGAVVVTGSPGAWHAERWEEQALGGPAVDTPRTDGPAGEPVAPPDAGEH